MLANLDPEKLLADFEDNAQALGKSLEITEVYT
jgi:hypothetical protein